MVCSMCEAILAKRIRTVLFKEVTQEQITRMRKAHGHMEVKQKSTSTKLLRKVRAWLIHKRKGGYSLLSKVEKGAKARTGTGL